MTTASVPMPGLSPAQLAPDNSAVLRLDDVSKTYPSPAGTITALSGVTLSAGRGEFVVIAGESGSGKSTLLALVAGIDRPTAGEITVAGTSLNGLAERALSVWRGANVGIVFQFFQLLPTLTGVENVMLPMDFCNRWPRGERRERAMALLERLGVGDQADKLPATMSGGQQQRVAVARSLANAPALLLADEPTGNLDSRTAKALLELLAGLARDGQTVLMVSHDHRAPVFATRTVQIADGRVVDSRAAG